MSELKIVIVLISLIFLIVCSPKKKMKIYLIGDSTMADKPVKENPERGWGQMLPLFFKDKVIIGNHARNGRSSKSFIDEGRWETVRNKIQTGDYVFIQFGHNDEKKYDSTRYAAPHKGYKVNLMKFVKETREKRGEPVLLTPIVRRRFDEKGEFYGTHGDYPQVVRQLAQQMDVPLIDMTKSSRALVRSAGVEKSKDIYLWVEPGKYKELPEGKRDNTHFSIYGAKKMAQLVVREIKNLDLDLESQIKDVTIKK